MDDATTIFISCMLNVQSCFSPNYFPYLNPSGWWCQQCTLTKPSWTLGSCTHRKPNPTSINPTRADISDGRNLITLIMLYILLLIKMCKQKPLSSMVNHMYYLIYPSIGLLEKSTKDYDYFVQMDSAIIPSIFCPR